ncbi:hypothetical protein GCM10010286_32230 [Streptomyces toxytricini]|nr:hypothetical protein GCM10010286_32230 [Streptomyces toxytricini]
MSKGRAPAAARRAEWRMRILGFFRPFAPRATRVTHVLCGVRPGPGAPSAERAAQKGCGALGRPLPDRCRTDKKTQVNAR